MPPAASWSVPISVGVDQLRPYTAYLFEVSAFTSDGEGQIASTMVRMPESGVEIGSKLGFIFSFYKIYCIYKNHLFCVFQPQKTLHETFLYLIRRPD